MQYQIISDSSCDLPTAVVNEKNLLVVPFYVSFDSEHYMKEMEEIGIRDFYEQMVANPKVFPKTSLPSAQDYADAFEPFVQAGKPIICICISTKFSGSMQSALSAKDILTESYPDAKITVIDATVNTVLQGQYVLEAVRMQEAGWEYDAVVKRLEEIKSTGRIFFTVGDLEYLKHGGRIGKLAGVAASALGIKPMITLKEGEIFSSGLARSRKKSLDKIIDMFLDYLKETGKNIENYSLSLGFGYDKEEAKAFRTHFVSMVNEKLKSATPLAEELLPLRQIGAAISVHTGPYALGLGVIERAF